MKFLTSTLGLKAIMAITGVILFGFIIGHMLGNPQIFLGADALNEYATFLHTQPALVWGTRIVMLFSIIGHIYSAFTLVQRSNAARPINYEQKKFLGSTYAVRTMRYGGVILLFFIVYHLLHLTVGANVVPDSAAVQGCSSEPVACDHVYTNVVNGFKVWWISVFYIVAQCSLGLHLSHGLWSGFRTLGFIKLARSEQSKMMAIAFGVLITIGNCSIPLAVLLGFIK
jgi:succinate dehydrogenase / fumarate reductase, cytochrome b subunit